MSESTPADGVQTPAPRAGRRTLKVTWHPNAVSGAVERAADLTSNSDPDGVCQVHWMDLACLLDLARAALAEPGEVEQAVMEEALRWRKIVEQWERGHQNEVLPYTAKLEAEVERLQRELDGVAVGSTASAGAPVSPVQTTDHADSRVSPVTDDMVHVAARAIAATSFTKEFGDSTNKHIVLAQAALSAALTGCTVAAAPELIELPKFQGCTDSNPDLCACGEAALMCAACDEEIEDSSRAYTVREKCKPWLADDDRDQEWQDVWWHFSCDERGPVSPKGDNTDDA